MTLFLETSDIDPTQQQLSDDRYGSDSGEPGGPGSQFDDPPEDPDNA